MSQKIDTEQAATEKEAAEAQNTRKPLWKRPLLVVPVVVALILVIVLPSVLLTRKHASKARSAEVDAGATNAGATDAEVTAGGSALREPQPGDGDLSPAPLPEIPPSNDPPLVHARSGSFRGAYSNEYNLTYFRRIPFADKPLGENRFRAPQPPQPIEGVYDADRSFDMCPQLNPKHVPYKGSEDCLYLSVSSRPWSQDKEIRRPVMVYFFSGGFVQGEVDSPLPQTYPVLNISIEVDYVSVHVNYRLNAFGFLAGAAVKEDGKADLNVGLLDQQAALRWVRDNIEAFGGDPEDVTIWGNSAGGGSVLAHSISEGGLTHPRLFHKAIASSPFWPRVVEYDSPEAEERYALFVESTGCAKAKSSLACLKEADMETLLDAADVVRHDKEFTTSTYGWGPVIDGSLLREPLSSALEARRIQPESVMVTWNFREGTYFLPPELQDKSGERFNTTNEGFRNWLRGFLPEFSQEDIEDVEAEYPEVAEDEEYRNNFERAGMIYRDVGLTCPAYWLARAANTGYAAEYTIYPATHGSDTNFWLRPVEIQTEYRKIYAPFVGAYASFIQRGDPNFIASLGQARFKAAELPKTSQNSMWRISKDGFSTTGMKHIEARCRFWMKNGNRIPL